MDLFKKQDEENLFVDEQLDPFEENDEQEPKPSTTVQVVLLHPYKPYTIYWVLNKKEPTSSSDVHPSPKPRGWGNPGGSVEPTDAVEETGVSLSFDEMLVKAARREVKDEAGFVNLNFVSYLPNQLKFLRYRNDNGHQVITLAARLCDFEQVLVTETDGTTHVKELEEIEGGQWFNLTISPTELFRSHKDLPYWSHIQRTVIVLQRLGKGSSRIHPLWRLVAFSIDGFRKMQEDLAPASPVSITSPAPVESEKTEEMSTDQKLTPEEQYEEDYRLWAKEHYEK